MIKKLRCLTVCAAILLILVQFSIAQETVSLHADRMLNVRTGSILSDVYIVINGDRIGKIGDSDIARGTRIIDLGDMTLLPGLIDMHTHLGYDINADWVNAAVKTTAADEAFRAAYNARKTLLAGFTTVREAGSGDFVDVALMKAIDKGMITGPRIVPCAHGITITGGHSDVTGFAPGIKELDYRNGVADGTSEVLKATRYQIKHGAKVIKIHATAGVLSFEETVGAQQLSEEEMRVIVEEAARHGLKVFAHAHGTEGIIAAARAGVASIEHGSLMTDEAIKVMKEHGTYHVPTTYLADVIKLEELPKQLSDKAKYILPLARKYLRNSIAAGVKIAFGTDAAVFPHGDNAKEFAVYVKLGMTHIDAIRTATLNAVDLLGVDDRGILEEGRYADIIAVNGNPLENIHELENVQFVMKGGKIYKMIEQYSHSSIH